MLRVVVTLAALGLVACAETGSSYEFEKPCEGWHSDYSHTEISCGGFYAVEHKLCAINSPDRDPRLGHECITDADISKIVRENKPCPKCGCSVKNVCQLHPFSFED